MLSYDIKPAKSASCKVNRGRHTRQSGNGEITPNGISGSILPRKKIPTASQSTVIFEHGLIKGIDVYVLGCRPVPEIQI